MEFFICYFKVDVTRFDIYNLSLFNHGFQFFQSRLNLHGTEAIFLQFLLILNNLNQFWRHLNEADKVNYLVLWGMFIIPLKTVLFAESEAQA